jgi:arsenate reductase
MLTIYHNPRCSKSRQTLQLIKESKQPVTVIEYLKTPLNQQQIEVLLKQLNCLPREMMRTKEVEFKQQNLQDADHQSLLRAMVDTPKLIERPIVVKGDRAIIGRPPENVLNLF